MLHLNHVLQRSALCRTTLGWKIGRFEALSIASVKAVLSSPAIMLRLGLRVEHDAPPWI